jgi:glycerophosphoryl diester phosphodiesterase
MVDLRRLLPNQPLQFLARQFTEGLVDKLDEYSLDLDIYYESLDKETIELVHSHGHLINCWTVDSKEKAEELVDMGVDFITSNILE